MNLLGRIPNFDEPIEALYICHENILKRMDTIERLAGLIESEGTTGLRRSVETWYEIVSFLRHNVANHTRDEEDGLFPILRERHPGQVEELVDDHGHAATIERSMAERFERLSSPDAEAADSDLREFVAEARALVEFYREHIRQENEVVFPMARKILTREELGELGRAMRRRRNIERPSM